MENVVEANGASSWEGPSAGLVVSVTEFYAVLNCSLGRAAACGLLQKWLRLGGGWRGLRGWDPHGGPVQSPVEHPGPTRRSQPMRCSTRDAPRPVPRALFPPPAARGRHSTLPHGRAASHRRAAVGAGQRSALSGTIRPRGRDPDGSRQSGGRGVASERSGRFVLLRQLSGLSGAGSGRSGGVRAFSQAAAGPERRNGLEASGGGWSGRRGERGAAVGPTVSERGLLGVGSRGAGGAGGGRRRRQLRGAGPVPSRGCPGPPPRLPVPALLPSVC